MPRYASVYILDVPFSLDRPFDYYVSPELGERIRVGCFVTVAFGVGNRSTLGVVTAMSEKTELADEKIKPIESVCPEELFLDENMLGLAFFMREQTLCTMGEAVHAMIPSAVFSCHSYYFRPTDKDSEPLKNKDLKEILTHIKNMGYVSQSALREKFGAASHSKVQKLLSKGFITNETVINDGANKLTRSSYTLAVTAEEARKILAGDKDAPFRIRAEGQLRAISALLSHGEAMKKEELTELGVTAQNIKALLEKGILNEEKTTVIRDPYSSVRYVGRKEIILNEGQKKAYDELSALTGSGEAKAALLYGVTGSGKTSVMTALIDKLLDMGKGVIMLLPEISLTPQTIGIFKGRYGDICAVVHSSLSSGERYDAYCRIRSGEARVVIGTRSAVFSPVKNLGLIVIDEEQEQTYKSDMDPKYHARDMARYRCAKENALMLLASATPSIESYKKALDGKYTLVKLGERYGGAKLPTVSVTDMREELQSGNASPISTALAEELWSTKKRGEQSILFLNRRGYNTFVSCRKSGEALTCPNCSVSLTYHTKRGTYSEGYLACHFCGHKEALPDKCPKCGSDKLARMGYGTQRVEEELSILMPDTAVMRMDTDTTSAKFSYDKMLGSFRAGEADILLGTQMVTKGHDFPSVTLVGVLLADMSLYLDDYRANERTFAMLTQVIGRAGRASENGKAVIQTNNPENDVIKLACAQDYETFYEREIKLRRLLVFPPFCDIVLMTISAEDETDLFAAVGKLTKVFGEMTQGDGEFSDLPIVAFGPFEAPVYKVEGRCRMRMVIKCRLNKRSRELFAEVLRLFSDVNSKSHARYGKKPYLSIDFNPSSL